MTRKSQSFATTDDLSNEVRQAARREGVSQSEIINRALKQYFATKVVRSSWDTDDGDSWYDEKKFYVASENRKGFSSYLRLYVPKNLAGQISRVVDSSQIPEYRSPQDFYRDALSHRAYKVAQWIDNEELKHESGLLMMLSEEERIAREKRDMESLIEQTRENLQKAWDKGDYDWIAERVTERLGKAASIPETLRDDYIGLLKEFQGKVGEVHNGRVSHIRKVRPEMANEYGVGD